jgi:hypothetical protein
MSGEAPDPVNSSCCLRIAHSFVKSARLNDSVQAPFARSFCRNAIYRWEIPASHLNVTICITHGPAAVNVDVALLLPAVVTTLSSAISPSGEVMIRDVNPLPAAPVVVNTMSAPKINSLALVVVAAARTRTASARPSRHIHRRHSPILQNAYIRKCRRLAEGNRNRVAATHYVGRIVDRLLQGRPHGRPDRQLTGISCAILHRLHRRRGVVSSDHHHVHVA